MDVRDIEFMLASSARHQLRERAPEPFDDPYSEMTSEEKSRLLMLQRRMYEEAARRAEEAEAKSAELLAKVGELLAGQNRMLSDQSRLQSDLSSLISRLAQKDRLIEELRKMIADKEEELSLRNRQTFGRKSQKSSGKKKHGDGEPRHDKAKENFDGTPESARRGQPQENGTKADASRNGKSPEKTRRLYRRGMTYKTMSADESVTHLSDLTKLPEGAVFVRFDNRYAYEQVSRIVEHNYQSAVYRLGGRLYEGYFPAEGEPEIIDIVPGTHASASFMACLAFNSYVLDTPAYREAQRIMAERMRISRMTLTNWLNKGALLAREAVKRLKDICLEKDSIVNCDETWCRVRVEDTYRKRHIWCLVNRKMKIVVYCYEDGSRGRDALRHILGDSRVRALQTDGYNVYMYLDDNMVDIEHICCLAHARAKFKYAAEQGDTFAEQIVATIGRLYGLEKEYERELLTPEQITACRNSLRTKEILIELRSQLDVQLAGGHPPRGELMDKAVRYLDTYWTRIFNYLKDGEYSIDNNIAERFIRPLAGKLKNSLFFGSHKMAAASAVFNTLISTCRAQGISALTYLKRLYSEIVRGNRDYGMMLPQTIGFGQ